MTRLRSIHPTEFQICVAIMDFVRKMEPIHPEFRWIFHTPNEGKAHVSYRVKMKAMGVRAGILDYKWDLARGGYHGFAMEVKDRRGKTSDEQDQYMDYLISQGYYVCLVRTPEDGISEIKNYHQGRTIRHPDKEESGSRAARPGAGETATSPAPINSRRYAELNTPLNLFPGQTQVLGGKVFVRN